MQNEALIWFFYVITPVGSMLLTILLVNLNKRKGDKAK